MSAKFFNSCICRFVVSSTLVVSLPHLALPQSPSTTDTVQTVANLQQLESKVSPAIVKGLIGAVQKQIARQGTSLASAGDDATTKALFQVYVGNLQEAGWTDQVDRLIRLHPEVVRNFEVTNAQAERITANLHALGAQAMTAQMIKSRLNISSEDREAIISEIQTSGTAKFLLSHTGGQSVATQGTAYNLYYNRPKLLPIGVNSVACNVVAIEVAVAVLTGNEIVAGIGGYWLWVNC